MTQAVTRLRSRVLASGPRPLIGWAFWLASLALLLRDLAMAWRAWTVAHPMALQALEAAVLADPATGLGALGVLLLRQGRGRCVSYVFLAVSAGTMASADMPSLLRPAVRLSSAPPVLDVVLAVTLGSAAMAKLDRLLPHVHAAPQGALAWPANALPLMVVAMAVHRLPEGFAVGAGFGSGDVLGWSTALSNGLQNIP